MESVIKELLQKKERNVRMLMQGKINDKILSDIHTTRNAIEFLKNLSELKEGNKNVKARKYD